MKLMVMMVLVFTLYAHAEGVAQTDKIDFKADHVPAEMVINQLKELTHYRFLYNHEEISRLSKKKLDFKDATIEEILNVFLAGSGLHYVIEDNVIIISPKLAKAQEEKKAVTITGVVKDAKGNTLPGVTVMVKGSGIGVASDKDGKFQISVPDTVNTVLEFSFIGMQRKEVKVLNQKPLNIVLEDMDAELEEVIVTGYQAIKKSNMVGSVNVIKREDLFSNGTNSIEQMLQGKIPGMVITNTSGLVGSRQQVRVRGTSTLLGNQEPVWVVDGIVQSDPLPFKAQDFNSVAVDNIDMVRNFVGNAISWLNPNDIDNITVLKDASATALYGTKAANGVIVINTKKGQVGRMTISYSGDMSVSSKMSYENMHLMNSRERVNVSREIYDRGLGGERELETIGYEGALRRYISKEITYEQFNTEVQRLETVNTDWFDLLYTNAFSHNHSLSVSGGTDKVQYYWSLNAGENKGTARGNDKKSYGGSITVNTILHPRITASLRLSAGYSKTNGFYQVTPYTYAAQTSRVIPAFEENGDLSFYQKSTKGYLYNVLNELEHTGNFNENQSLTANFNLKYTIIEGLRYETIFEFGRSVTNGESYADERTYYITEKRGYEFGRYLPNDMQYKQSQLPHGGELNEDNTQNINYTWRNSVFFSKVFQDRHNLNITFQQELSSKQYTGSSSTDYGYLPDRGKTMIRPPLTVLDLSNKPMENGLYKMIKRTMIDRRINEFSVLGAVDYSYDRRYVLSASFRTDANNRFGQDTRHRFSPTWAAGFRWNVTNESWMKDYQGFVNEMNVRVNYGWQGNTAENFGPDLIASIPGSGVSDVTGEYLLEIKTLGYSNLRWEKTKTTSVGVDFGFFKNRLMATVEYYNKETEDVIIYKQVPVSYGVASMPINGGNVWNRGWELNMTVVPVRLKDFVWTFSFNTSKNFNKVNSTIQQNDSWLMATSGQLNKKGYAVNSIWAFDFLGLSESDGSPLLDVPSKTDNLEALKDATAYMKYMGSLNPDFTGGFSNSFRYKTLTLSASFSLSVGGKKFLSELFSKDDAKSTPSAYSNLSKDLVNRWQKPGDEKRTDIPSLPSANIPKQNMPVGSAESRYYLYNYSDARVVNASFLRCNNISLMYSLPQHLLTKINLQGVSLTAGMTNPFMIVSKDYNGVDPEVATGSQPISRTFSLGINISL